MTRVATILLMAAALGACEHGRGYVAGDRAVAAVVQDEGQRQKAAQAATGGNAQDAMAVVAGGPKPSIGASPP